MIDADDVLTRLTSGLSGRYTIAREVGQGGMARVFEAVDHKHERRVAMKVLRPEVAAALGKDRFMSEIRIAANLSHPHILPVHESGESEGLLYYVMPFVQGESLRDRLEREGKLPFEETLRITRDVGFALSYAHEQGIVHRDLKPENIMLSGGIAVVTDFGIARVMSAAGRERLTATGLVPGTPAYMSPEQATGESTIDGRSDIYSMACVVYEMLAGRPPFSGNSLMQMIAQHAVAPIPPLNDSRPDLPVHVSRSLEVALAKRPDERFATVGDLVASLEGERAVPLAPRRSTTTTARARRRPLVLTAALVVVAATAFGLWRFSASSGSSGNRIPIVAVLPFEHMGPPEDQLFTDGMTDELSDRIGEVGGVSVISRASAMQFSVRQLREISSQLRANYVVTGSVRTEHTPDGRVTVLVKPRLLRVPGGEELWSDDFSAVLTPGEMLKLQQGIAGRLANQLNIALRPDTRAPLEQGLTNNLEAYKFYLQANLSAAQFLVPQEQFKAIELYNRAVLLDSSFALAWARLAQANATFFSLFDRTPERLRRLNESVARATALQPDDAETRIARGYAAMFSRRDADSALIELEAARALQPNNSRLLWALGFVQRHKGDLDDAFESFTAASTRDPRSAMYIFEALTVPFLKRDYPRAADLNTRVRELAPDWLPAIVAAASIQFYSGNLQAARDSLQAAALVRPRELTLHMVQETLLRPLWEMLVPDTMQRMLDSLSLATARVDSVAFYYARGRRSIREGRADARGYFAAMHRVALGRRAARPAGPWEYLDLAAASLELGDSTAAVAYTDSLLAQEPMALDALRGPFAALEAARLYARLGASDRALPLLQRLVASPGPASPWLLRTDPAFRRLRTNAQFRQLAQLTS